MKRLFTAALAAACSASLLVSGCASSSAQAASPTQEHTTDASQEASQKVSSDTGDNAQEASEEDSNINEELPQTIRVFGPVSRDGDRLMVDNQSGQSYSGSIVLLLSETSLVLDGINGFPMEPDDIKDGETLYAYIGPAMTMSLPPQTTAEVIFAGVPEDGKAPDYFTISSVEKDGDGYKLTDGSGNVFTVPSDCPVTPYLTRQMVTLDDLTEGRTCIVWSDDSNQANKIVLFNESPDAGK